MRLTKLPIPLLIAAAALTGVVYIYVYLTAPPMPIHTDPNFSQPLLPGVTYLWRGAAFQYVFSADNQISMAYGAPYHLIYLYGPLYNISLGGGKIFIIFGADIRPLYVFKTTVSTESGYTGEACLIFKLKDVTPQNSTIANLTLYLPVPFDQNDVLTKKEDNAVYYLTGTCIWMDRVIQILANSTHIIFQTAYADSPILTWRLVMALQPLAPGKTIRVTNQPVSGSYVVGDKTFAVMALPYLHFAITPQDATTLTVYVS